MKFLNQLLFSFLLLVSSSLSSQQLNFNKVISPLGSFAGFVGGITQDNNGYMWIATAGGLFRYDGYHFKIYTHDPTDSNSISATHLETVYADSKGMIWIGTWANGLDRLDPATGKFSHFQHKPNDQRTLSDNVVRAILEDHNGVIWIGTQGGLDKYEPRTGTFHHYKHAAKDPNSLSCDKVRAIYEDKKGTLWIGTGSVWAGQGGETDEGGLNRFDQQTGKFIRYIYEPKNPDRLINNKVSAIFEDSKGNFWIGTAGDGLHTMDRSTGKFERHLYDPSHPEKLSRPQVSPQMLDYITFIKEDALGNVWIGTLASGLNRYDSKNRTISHYGDKDNSGGFLSQSSWCFCNSFDGTFWIGTFQGVLYRADPFRKNISQVFFESSVLAFNTDSANNLWLGTSRGLIYQEQKTGRTKTFVHSDKDTLSLTNGFINSLYRDSRGILWVGTDNGLNRFNSSENNFTRYVHNPMQRNSISGGQVYVIAEAGNDSLWIGTSSGVDLFNKSNGTFIHFRNDPSDTNSLNADIISSLFPEPSGDLWVGLYNVNGLDLYDHKTGKFKHVLKSRTVTSIVRDAAGILWLGTDDGLYLADNKTNRFTKFYTPGSQIDVSHVLSIQVDSTGKLWVSTTSGIFKVDPMTREVIVYGSNYGVDGGNLILSAGYKGMDGKIYFGYLIGYYAISPEEMSGNNSSGPRIIFTGLSVRGRSVTAGEDIIGKTSIEEIKKLSLRYNQNVFSFEFAGIHYSSPEYNRHLYMLENYDQGWHEAGAEKSASYFNVPPGKYIFHLKVASSDGVWAERSMEIIISPPWWATWWFRVLSVIAMVIVIYSIIKERSRKLKTENILLEQKVNERTQQLQQSIHDLKSAQAQLIQSEKMASLGELTAGIAHEIQNPLNFVNNFSEVNNELVDELKSELATGNMQSAIEIADNIKENGLKINHHGKRAGAIVKSMLQHSRTSSGQKELTDINALADEYLRLAYHGLRAKDKTFNAKFETGLDPSVGNVNIVQQDIGRVLLNLISNAFYAVNEKQKTENGKFDPCVSVQTRKLNGNVEIIVKDNGNGIPQKVFEKIFQPFFTTKPTGEGTGLGLSLAYDVIKAHGGDIKVETKQGEGSEFIIQLPV